MPSEELNSYFEVSNFTEDVHAACFTRQCVLATLIVMHSWIHIVLRSNLVFVEVIVCGRWFIWTWTQAVDMTQFHLSDIVVRVAQLEKVFEVNGEMRDGFWEEFEVWTSLFKISILHCCLNLVLNQV